jgi:hypothetical protein
VNLNRYATSHITNASAIISNVAPNRTTQPVSANTWPLKLKKRCNSSISMPVGSLLVRATKWLSLPMMLCLKATTNEQATWDFKRYLQPLWP